MLNVKKLAKAAKIVNEIAVLDADIIQIDKIALLVANGKSKQSFDLKIEEIKEEESKVRFDEDGSIINIDHVVNEHYKRIQSVMINGLYWNVSEKKENSNLNSLSMELSESAALSILGILLYEKQTRRQELMNKLKNMGIHI